MASKRCPQCGYEFHDESVDQIEQWPKEEKVGFADWYMTETGLLALLKEAEKAMSYIEIA